MAPSSRQTSALFSRMIAKAMWLVEAVAIARYRQNEQPTATIDHDFSVKVSMPGGVAEKKYHFWIDGTGQVFVWPAGSKPPAEIAAELVLADAEPDGTEGNPEQ